MKDSEDNLVLFRVKSLGTQLRPFPLICIFFDYFVHLHSLSTSTDMHSVIF